MTVAEKLVTIAENEQKVYDVGYSHGNDVGYDEGIEVGKKAEHDAFWDNHLTKTSMIYGFSGSLWSAETFRPPQGTVIQPVNATGLFLYSRMKIDLAAHLEEIDVTLDFSKATSINTAFSSCYFTRLGEINTTSTSSLSSTFSGANYLQTIDKLILLKSGATTFSTTFTGCTALEHITIEGTIGNNISFADCPLTVESAWSVFSATADLSGTGKTATLTFSKHTYDLLDVPKYDEETGDEMDSDWVEMEIACDMYGWILEVAS